MDDVLGHFCIFMSEKMRVQFSRQLNNIEFDCNGAIFLIPFRVKTLFLHYISRNAGVFN